MSVGKLTLKERVEKIETILNKLGLDVFTTDLDNKIQETIEDALKEAKAELNEIKVKASTQIGNIPEILDEICRNLENETGINLVLLRKKIKEL